MAQYFFVDESGEPGFQKFRGSPYFILTMVQMPTWGPIDELAMLRREFVRSKPNKEDFLARQLEAQGVQVYCPHIRVRVVNPRARKVRPYFPGYIFVQVDLKQTGWSALQRQPGAAGLVSFGGEPASVPDSLINAIRKRVDEVNASDRDLIKGLSQGEIVTIQSGPFAGHEAIFDARLSGDERVRVLLKLINKQQLPYLMIRFLRKGYSTQAT